MSYPVAAWEPGGICYKGKYPAYYRGGGFWWSDPVVLSGSCHCTYIARDCSTLYGTSSPSPKSLVQVMISIMSDNEGS